MQPLLEESLGQRFSDALCCAAGFECLALAEEQGNDHALLRAAEGHYRQASYSASGLAGYNLACCLTLRGKCARAVATLAAATAAPGCPGRTAAMRDPQLADIREDVAKMEWPEEKAEQEETEQRETCWGAPAFTKEMMTEETELQAMAKQYPCRVGM